LKIKTFTDIHFTLLLAKNIANTEKVILDA